MSLFRLLLILNLQFFSVSILYKKKYNLFQLSAKGRGIAIPTDLESQVASMFNKAAMLSRQTSKWLQAAKQPKIERTQSQVIFIKNWLHV